MREIKFRGKAINRENTWFVGDLRRDIKANEFWIFPQDEHPGIDKHRVHPETIGQYIGLKDKNGKDIYDGDIIELSCECCRYEIVWDDKKLCLWPNDDGYSQVHNKNIDVWEQELTVIGNIHMMEKNV